MPDARGNIFEEPDRLREVENPPGVILWFKVYALCMAGLYVLCAGLSIMLLFIDPAEVEMDPVEARITGTFVLVMSLGLIVVFLIPLFSQPRPWLWIYNLVLICLGLTSCCLWPATIPLLINWLKPEAKACFGRT